MLVEGEIVYWLFMVECDDGDLAGGYGSETVLRRYNHVRHTWEAEVQLRSESGTPDEWAAFGRTSEASIARGKNGNLVASFRR